MSVVKCKNCRKEISKKTSICPHCGVKTHPIKDIVKVVIIVLVVLIILALVRFMLSGSLTSAIKENLEKSKYKKYIGNFELVGTIEDYENAFSGNVYLNDGSKMNKSYKIEDIRKTLNLENEETDFYKYTFLLDYEFVYNTKQDYAILNVGSISDESVYACFKVDKNNLKQTNCVAEFTNGLPYIENIGLKYKKLN